MSDQVDLTDVIKVRVSILANDEPISMNDIITVAIDATRQHDKARYVEAIRSMKDQMPGLIPEYIKKDDAIAAIEGVDNE
jgi:hypothetical protein